MANCDAWLFDFSFCFRLIFVRNLCFASVDAGFGAL